MIGETPIIVFLLMISFVLGVYTGKLISGWEYKKLIETYEEMCNGWEQLVKDMRVERMEEKEDRYE